MAEIQLISGDGVFDVAAMEYFTKKIKLGEPELPYAVVSIIGSQSTGKSTLLNHLWRTKFVEMNATLGRCKTTRGIWLSKATNIETCTLILDIEGIDGVEKKGDDTFEMQSALFAVAMSDVLLVNLWCHDVGRWNGGCNAVLAAVFEVMMRLVAPSRRTLLFVIRDYNANATPLEKLKQQLQEVVQQTYDSVPKPEAHKQTALSSFFDVLVTALPHYELQRKEFDEQVVALRQLLVHSTTCAARAKDQQDRVPASAISLSAQSIWKKIKENKELDLHANKTMVASVRCDKIVKERFAEFLGSEGWDHLTKTLKSGPYPGYGNFLTGAIRSCLSKYDEEASCYDEGIRSAKHLDLKNKLLQSIQPAYQTMLDHLRTTSFHGFNVAFDDALAKGEDLHVAAERCRDKYLSDFREGCKDATIEQAKWGSDDVLDRLQGDINGRIRVAKSAEQVKATKETLEKVREEAALQHRTDQATIRAATKAAEQAKAMHKEDEKAAADRAAAAEARTKALIVVMIAIPALVLAGAAAVGGAAVAVVAAGAGAAVVAAPAGAVAAGGLLAVAASGVELINAVNAALATLRKT